MGNKKVYIRVSYRNYDDHASMEVGDEETTIVVSKELDVKSALNALLKMGHVYIQRTAEIEANRRERKERNGKPLDDDEVYMAEELSKESEW